jgi:hypothetical protein
MDKKILYYLLHGKSCNDRVDNVLNTWGKDVDVIFYSDYEDLNKKVYKVTDKPGYWDLEEKHINGFKFLKNNFLDYEWYFFCDDDTFVNTEKMNEFLKTAKEDIVYGYLINCWPNMPFLYYPSGGAGVLIHKSVLNKLIDKLTIKGTKFADVTLGLNLIDENIRISNCEFLHSEKPNHYGITDENIKKHITFHHIKSLNEMQDFYNLCKN